MSALLRMFILNDTTNVPGEYLPSLAPSTSFNLYRNIQVDTNPNASLSTPLAPRLNKYAFQGGEEFNI